MARPIRSQLALATVLLLLPVGVVITIAATEALFVQTTLLDQEASAYARVVANYIDATGETSGAAIDGFLDALPVPRGSQLILFDASGAVVGTKRYFTGDVRGELRSGAATPRTRRMTVSVAIPSSLAWARAGDNYRPTILISGLATIILLAVQAWFLRRLVPALARLERSAVRVGAGDLTVPFTGPMPSRELEHLRDAFHDMVTKLRVARESIARQVEEERRMRHELESLQLQVIRQERLAAIGVLVSGIAHELNNPLQAISGSSELLQFDASMDPRARESLALIHQESARASAIIRNLSRFGRQQESTPGPVNLTEVLTSVIELRQRRLSDQDIRLERDERATRPAIAVFTELQQVALNFVINAEQSLRSCDPAVRRIILRTRDVDGGVCLEVEDSGSGVAAEHEAKLFQPFFTTKPVGEGTGLGLSVSYGIVRSLGGTIGYRRGELGGALFYFTVPASTAAAAGGTRGT